MSPWRKVPLRAIYQRVELRDRADLPLLSVYRDHGVVLRDERDDNNNRPSEDLSTYKHVRPGDLVVNKMKTWQGSLAVSGHEGIVSPAYYVGRRIADVENRFMHHLLRSLPLIAEYGARSKGIRPSQWDLPWDEFASIKVAIPAIVEQKAIADYLDRETARIDALIEKKKRMVALFRERRRALITAEVTGELGVTLSDGPFRSAKDLLNAFGRMADIQLGKMLQPAASSAQDLDVPYLRAGHLSLVPDELPRMWASPREVVQYRVETGDILVAEGGDVGRVGFVPLSASGALIQNSLHRVRPRGGRDRRFLAYVLEAVYLGDWLEVLCNKSTFGHLTVEKLKALRVPDPPVAKQRAIADYLDAESAHIDALVEKTKRMGEMLSEHRQALITAAVTGELEIPAVAA